MMIRIRSLLLFALKSCQTGGAFALAMTGMLFVWGCSEPTVMHTGSEQEEILKDPEGGLLPPAVAGGSEVDLGNPMPGQTEGSASGAKQTAEPNPSPGQAGALEEDDSAETGAPGAGQDQSDSDSDSDSKAAGSKSGSGQSE